MSIELTGFIEKVTTTVSKDGDIIAKITLSHNLTKSGVLSTAGELMAIQDKVVTCSIERGQVQINFAVGGGGKD